MEHGPCLISRDARFPADWAVAVHLSRAAGAWSWRGARRASSGGCLPWRRRTGSLVPAPISGRESPPPLIGAVPLARTRSRRGPRSRTDAPPRGVRICPRSSARSSAARQGCSDHDDILSSAAFSQIFRASMLSPPVAPLPVAGVDERRAPTPSRGPCSCRRAAEGQPEARVLKRSNCARRRNTLREAPETSDPRSRPARSRRRRRSPGRAAARAPAPRTAPCPRSPAARGRGSVRTASNGSVYLLSTQR